MTELETLKKKKKDGKATPKDLTRLELLQGGEPLSAADLENVKKREEDRKAADKAAFEAKQKAKATEAPVSTTTSEVAHRAEGETISEPATTLDIPPDHPRITTMKEALMPFTQIEAHDSRPDEFILFTRGVNITAGDVRKARKAMKL